MSLSGSPLLRLAMPRFAEDLGDFLACQCLFFHLRGQFNRFFVFAVLKRRAQEVESY